MISFKGKAERSLSVNVNYHLSLYTFLLCTRLSILVMILPHVIDHRIYILLSIVFLVTYFISVPPRRA